MRLQIALPAVLVITASLGTPWLTSAAEAPTSQPAASVNAGEENHPTTESTPDRLWKQLPIYSPTQDEAAKPNVFVYAVSISLQDVEQYYLARLPKLGWKVTKREAFETAKLGGPGLHLSLEGEKRAASIWILVNTTDHLTYINLACFGEHGACPDK